ncbi:MAG TPA: Uma2 family endonuclease [Candidatus Baltobacteraceae bacterium]|nr:Uma2 family endonuclease [Candidatus Baltobacteraceae bacterium]
MHALSDKPEVEYLDGHPYPKMSPSRAHSIVQINLVRMINEAAGELGEALPEWRCRVGSADGTDTALVPDITYISAQRLLPLSDEDLELPPFSPDIAVEIRSPGESIRLRFEKVARYLATGAILVLDVDPAQRTLVAHSAGDVRSYDERAQFVHPLAPWLIFDVARVFEGMKRRF